MVSVCRLLTLGLVNKCFTLVVHWENAHTQKVLFSGHFLFPAPRIVGCKCGGSRKCLKNINTRSQPAGMQLGGVFFFHR